MLGNNLEFMKVFKPEIYYVKEFEHWIIILREGQVTLGSCIIVLKREILSFGNMTRSEAIELPAVISWYEKKCISIFCAVKFNYITAMMKDNFAHFHAFPRYAEPVFRYGLEWVDERWPRVIQFKPTTINDDILQLIVTEMRE